MNKIVFMWAPLAAAAALLLSHSPSDAKAPRPVAKKPAAASAQTAAARAAAIASYASEPGCVTGRRMLWSDGGWIVRRVTSCR